MPHNPHEAGANQITSREFETSKVVNIDDTLVKSIDALVAAIASYSDPRTLRQLGECQQCRNHLMYLLDTRSDEIMARRVLDLQHDHRVHVSGSTDGPSTDTPRIRTFIQ